MVVDVIRKGVDGFDVNYGPLVVAELNGIKFAMQDWRAKQLGFKLVEVEEIPEFLTELKLVMQYAVAQIDAYVFDKADIKPLGEALSLVDTLGGHPSRVDAVYMARILMMWERGVVASEQRGIDHFYSNLTEAEIEGGQF